MFGLSDSKVLVFNEDNECTFETSDDYSLFLGERNEEVKQKLLQTGNQSIIDAMNKGENIWRFPLVRQMLRKEYRNNEYEPYSYGTFTGEEPSLSFVRTGAVSLKDAKYVIGTTDGCLDQIKEESFIKELEKYVDTPEKIIPLLKESGSEGTAVIYRKKA